MFQAEHKSFKTPDDIREFEFGRLELIKIAGGMIGKLILQPGWRWSKHIQPIAQTKWCEAPHFQYQLSGCLHIAMSDGTEFETTAGHVSWLPSGHDAWVVGNEEVVLIDWAGAINFAK